MTGPEAETDAAGPREAFSQVVAESRSRIDRLARLRAEAARVAVTETSPDGAVTVTVDTGGVLTDLRITDKLSGQPGERIADQVLATMRQAQARIAGRMKDVMRDTVGDDKEVTDRVLAVYHDRFPEPTQSDDESNPDPDPRQPRTGWDDDSIMRY